MWVFGHTDVVNADMSVKFSTLIGYCRPIWNFSKNSRWRSRHPEFRFLIIFPLAMNECASNLVHLYFTVTQYQTYEKIQDGRRRHLECRLLAIFPSAMNKCPSYSYSQFTKKNWKNQNSGEMKLDAVLTETNLRSFFRYGVQQKNSWIYYRSAWCNLVARQTSFRDNDSDSMLLMSIMLLHFYGLLFKFVAYVTHVNRKMSRRNSSNLPMDVGCGHKLLQAVGQYNACTGHTGTPALLV